jgi:threonine dehydratase
MNGLVELKDITNAQQIIADRVHRTPVISSKTLGELVDADLCFKAELFQKIGSFTPRGALNKLEHLSDEEKKGGYHNISG